MPRNRTLIDPRDLISLADAGREYGYNAEHLRQMAANGRLQAWCVAKNWVTTRNSMKKFMASLQKTGRPRMHSNKRA